MLWLGHDRKAAKRNYRKAICFVEGAASTDSVKLRCSGCKRVWYCSAGCQHVSWSSHKADCSILKGMPVNMHRCGGYSGATTLGLCSKTSLWKASPLHFIEHLEIQKHVLLVTPQGVLVTSGKWSASTSRSRASPGAKLDVLGSSRRSAHSSALRYDV